MSITKTTCIGAAVLALFGATNAFGQLQIVDDPGLGEFIDISKTGGTLLPLDDDGEVELPIGTFGGNHVLRGGVVVVGLNGGLGFGGLSLTDLAPVNQMIPSRDAFLGGQATLPLWDDIDDKEGCVYYLDIPGDRVIVQWNWVNFDGMGGTLQFQAILLFNFEATGTYAQFLYRIAGSVGGAGDGGTIGYQDGGAGFNDIQFSFNLPDAVIDGTVLSLLIQDTTPCDGDIDRDGAVGFGDVLRILGAWGPCAPDVDCDEDVDGDGTVGAADLTATLGAWGSC